jgi:cytochrome c biogenesis protein CcmG, thiol:disulfide interchange protein DsbE
MLSLSTAWMPKNEGLRLGLSQLIDMKKILKNWLLPLLVILLCLSGCNQRPVLRIGDKPERVEMTDIHGKTLAFPDDLHGRVAMVRFWSVDCPSCNKEIIKAMEKLYVKYRDQGFVAVSVNVKQPAEAAEDFRKLDKLITYPVLLDPDASVANKYGLVGLPITFILNREGIVKQKVIGETGIEMFESFLPPLLMK